MITELTENHLDDVSLAHLLAWQKAFKGILSDGLLKNLCKEEFYRSWQKTIQNRKRINFVALTDDKKAVGFISFGPYNTPDRSETAEIYGIYVNPNNWKQGYGRQLMEKAISALASYSIVRVWVMTKNISAINFYENFGFKPDGNLRISTRKDEQFEESRYFLVL